MSLTTGKTPVTEAISRGSKITAEGAEQIEKIIAGGEVSELWRTPSKAESMFRLLVKLGAFSQSDVIGLKDAEGLPSKAGKEQIEMTLLGAAISDTRALASLKREAKNKLLRSLPSLIRLRRLVPGFSEKLVGAIDGVQDVRATGLSFNESVAQQTIVHQPWKHDPTMRSLTKLLVEEGQMALASRLRGLANELAEIEAGQGDMFLSAEERSTDQVMSRWLGDRGTLFSLSPPVDSEEFRAFYGNSPLVGEDGDPLIMYHGTVETDESGN